MNTAEAIQIVRARSLGRTRYDGQAQYIDEILVEEIDRLRELLAESWWYAMGQESIDKGDGWMCPYMSEAEWASKELHRAGLAEKHPDHDWYRPVHKSNSNTG
jgi:hypothetical protein